MITLPILIVKFHKGKCIVGLSNIAHLKEVAWVWSPLCPRQLIGRDQTYDSLFQLDGGIEINLSVGIIEI